MVRRRSPVQFWATAQMEFTFKNLDAFETITDVLASRYNDFIFQLKGKESAVSVEALQDVKAHSDSELLLFMLDQSGAIAGMAQASFHRTPSKYAAYINTVVVDEAYRGQGLGTLLMNELEKRAKKRWNNLQAFSLTSSPERGTQGFYVRLGYRMRTKEAGDETIVYLKDA